MEGPGREAGFLRLTDEDGGRARLSPVYEDEEANFKEAKPAAAPAKGKILYYRNPMGLPDTSPVPKKDWMGMDYIAVYEGEQGDSDAVKVSPGRLQRTGVKTDSSASCPSCKPSRRQVSSPSTRPGCRWSPCALTASSTRSCR